jgi:two-component system cell cycle sensor histidine kinase/response regulator CckA
MKAGEVSRKKQFSQAGLQPKPLHVLSRGAKQTVPASNPDAIQDEAHRPPRRLGERQLRASEARNRLLMESCTDLIARLTPEGRLLSVSRKCQVLLGYPPVELVGRHTTDLVHLDDADEFVRTLAAVANSSGSRTTTLRLRHKDGSYKWLEATTQSLRSSAVGAVEEILVVARDLTERQQAAEALEGERTFVSAVLDTVAALVGVVDREGRIVRFNPACERTLGYTSAEVIGRPFWELLPVPKEVTKAEAVFRRLLAGQWPTQYETYWLSKDGKRHSLVWSTTFLRDATGEIRYVIGSGIDTTESRRAEEALAAERERLAVALRSTGDGLLATDRDGRVVLINEVAQMLTGWTPETALGRPLREVLAHFGGNAVNAALRRCADGLPHDMMVEGPPLRIFEMRTKPITEGPETGGQLLLVRNVTAEREVQRTMEQQGRLAAVGQLAAGIAHDFNNILTVVIGIAERLKIGSRVPNHVRAKLDLIAQQGRRASHLIRQILDFSRRSVIAERQRMDLVPFLKEIVKLLERAIPEHIELTAVLPPGEYRVLADPTQLQQVLTNLALNARDAMPNGGQLRIALSRLSLAAGDRPPLAKMPAGEWIVLSVSDTGTGMPPEVLRHVFEPFFTTKEPGSGTGLGLAQVYGLVKQHDGFIDVNSSVGAGTTFTICLPAVVVPHTAAAVERAQGLFAGRGETILVVEDDAAVREVNTWLLEGMGYHVLPARTGEEALQLYAQHRNNISLVLMDMVMPGMGGAALYRTLRRYQPATPVIMLSGYPLGAEAKNARLDGIVDWLRKPLDPDQLGQAVRRALQRQID